MRRSGRVIAAVDSRGGRVAIHGWKTVLPISAVEAVRALEPYCSEFLYTHVDKEGLMQGTDMDAILAVKRATSRRLTAAGGITTWDEIDRARRPGRRCGGRHGCLHGTAAAPPPAGACLGRRTVCRRVMDVRSAYSTPEPECGIGLRPSADTEPRSVPARRIADPDETSCASCHARSAFVVDRMNRPPTGRRRLAGRIAFCYGRRRNRYVD
jgi:hypothetical protein